MKKTILIVDDDEKNRRLLSFVFSSRGYEVIEAADGEQALEEARRRLPSLILMDYRLPGISGSAVIKALKSEGPTSKIPMIIVTASAMKTDETKIVEECGCDGYITKPVDVSGVVELVRRQIGHSEGSE